MVTQNKIISLVTPLAEKAATENGCTLWDVEYQKEGGAWVLRVYIDRETPIDHAACQAISEQLSGALNEIDPIEHEYMLEVSSPGLERAFKKEEQFARFVGQTVKMQSLYPLCGAKRIRRRFTRFC